MTLQTRAEALRLETNAAGTAVTGVLVERDGVRETFTADIVVVSAGAANTAALLLSSASEAHPHGLANGSGQVGRNYMFHNCEAVLALSKDQNPTVFQKTLGINDFYFGSRDFELPAGQHPDGREVVGGHVPGREAAADQARARAGRWSRWRATRSTSGCPPRTCRARTTASRCATTAASRSPTGDQRPAQGAAAARAQVAARAHRHAPRSPVPAPRLPQERHPGGGLRPPGRAPAASASTRRRRCSTPTAARTRSTTSTSSTPASSRASARSTRR